jgi:hypothetical protein
MGFARLAWPRYAFANLGHPYRSVGQWLVLASEISRLSLRGRRAPYAKPSSAAPFSTLTPA